MKKIILFYGSFDPIHNGHIEMADFCKNKFKMDKIMFLPLGNPPHKENITDKELRIKMIEGAIDEKTSFLSRIEVDRTGKTYTYETIKWLKENTRKYLSHTIFALLVLISLLFDKKF